MITALILRCTPYDANARRARAVIALLGGRFAERSHPVATIASSTVTLDADEALEFAIDLDAATGYLIHLLDLYELTTPMPKLVEHLHRIRDRLTAAGGIDTESDPFHEMGYDRSIEWLDADRAYLETVFGRGFMRCRGGHDAD